MTPTQRKLAARLATTQPAGYTERHAVITAYTGGFATVRISGDPTDLPGMRVATSVSPTVGATVIVRIKGSDAYVAARLA